jgi:hypothetical protein
MEDTTILTLAGQAYEVTAPPLGVLKKIIAAINRAATAGGCVDTMMREAPLALGLLIGKTPEEMDALPIGFNELLAAFNRVPEICGLVEKENAPGEAQAG